MDSKEDQVSTEQTENTQKDPSDISYKSEIFKEPSLKSENKVVIYSNSDDKITANVFFANDTFWMTQKTMAELFGVKIPAISKHLKNIYNRVFFVKSS